MKKVTKIDYKPPEEEKSVKVEKTDGQCVHFYEVGEKLMIPISLFVTLKFGLVNPKVLILVETIKDVYRYNLFLDRVKIPNIGLYNPENPIDLKFYSLSIWMNGPINIMVATKAIYADLNSNIFKENCKKTLKRDYFPLTNLATVVCINVNHLKSDFTNIFNNFNHKPFIMTFVENQEVEVEALQSLIKLENSIFETVKSKEFPISKKELEAFKYRITDVWQSLGNHKVDMYQKYDFKKKILRSPDMKTHFE